MPRKTRAPKPARPRPLTPLTKEEATLYLALVRALVALRMPDAVLASLFHSIETARSIPEPDEIIQALCETGRQFGRPEMLARAIVAISEALQARRPLRPADIRHPEEIEVTGVHILRVETGRAGNH